MRKRPKSKTRQLGLFPDRSRGPELPLEVRQKVIGLVARMLRQHVAQRVDRGWVGEACHD